MNSSNQSNSDKTIRIGAVEEIDSRHKIQATQELDGRKWSVYYQASEIQLTPSLEKFNAIALIPAMLKGYDIAATGEASRRFLDNLDAVRHMNTRCT